MKNTRILITLFVCAIFSILIVFGLNYFDDNALFTVKGSTSDSLVKQETLEYSKDPHTYYKLYHSGQLVGMISDMDYIEDKIAEIYHADYEEIFPDAKLTFGEDYYVSEELGYYVLENVDDKIVDYLKDNKGFGINTNIINFSTDEGIYASIAVWDLSDFENARDRFLTNFISEEDLKKLENGESNDTLDRVGSQAVGFRVREDITATKGVADVDRIMTEEDEVLEYLCYGDNEERKYYTVQEGDTLQGVGFFNENITPTQIMLINPGVIHSTDQVLEVGMKLNVTYFTSPITVIVTMESLREEVVYPESPLYIEDNTLYTNVSEVVQEEENGSQYTLYEETWVNGVLAGGEAISSSIIEQPVQGIIKVGTRQRPNVGTGSFIWPVNNPIMTCSWGCYAGHRGIDINNRYNVYDRIYAADNGTVVVNGYDAGGWGYYVRIDHNNGFQTLYGHMRSRSPLVVGQTIVKGEYVGDVGNTGRTTAAHLHFEIYVGGTRVNPCSYMNCASIY